MSNAKCRSFVWHYKWSTLNTVLDHTAPGGNKPQSGAKGSRVVMRASCRCEDGRFSLCPIFKDVLAPSYGSNISSGRGKSTVFMKIMATKSSFISFCSTKPHCGEVGRIFDTAGTQNYLACFATSSVPNPLASRHTSDSSHRPLSIPC